MGNADIEMGGVGPAKPLLSYGVPYPPELEATQRTSDGSIEVTDWTKHARYYGARDHPKGSGFEVRRFNEGDPAGKGKWSSHDWDVEYRLGPPSTSVNWNNMIEKWGLQVLDKAGFINLDPNTADSYMHPTGRFASRRNPSGKDGNRVHPIFRRQVWRSLSEEDYQTIMPALLLASAFLDDPTTLCLFHAISAPAEQMVTFEDPILKTCKRLQVPETLTESEQWSVFHKICAMRKWTSFYWESSDILKARGALGYCQPLVHKDGSRTTASGPHTSQTKIGVSLHYLWVLRGYTPQTDIVHDTHRAKARRYFNETLKSTGVPDSHRPPETCIESAGVRTAFLFATLLVHELAHAFSRAYFQRPDDRGPNEPWVADNRSNEMGHAMERFIVGGTPRPCSFSPLASSVMQKDFLQDSAYAQFGIYFPDKWKQWATPGNAKLEQFLKQGLQEDRNAPLISWPVPQRQIYDYFSRDLWSMRVPRYGLEALKMVKIPQWGVYQYPGPDPNNPWKGSTLR